MATQLATTEKKPQRVSIIDKMAGQYDMDPKVFYDTLAKTAFKGCKSNEEFAALCIVANEHKLNPFTKEIYAFPAKGGGIVPLVSIDGWLRIMNEHPQFDGISHEDIADDKGNLIAIECTIWRKDRTKPIKIIEYLSECKRNSEPWNTMEARMLRHKSTIQCARYAFGFSGIYDEQDVDAIIRGDNVKAIGTPPMRNVTPEKDDETDAEEITPEPADEAENEPEQAEEEISQGADEKRLHERQREQIDAAEGKADADTGEIVTLASAKAEIDSAELVPDINSRCTALCEHLNDDDAADLMAYAGERIDEMMGGGS